MAEYDNALHMMESIGGSFVRALADCYYAADTTNKVKLRETFAEYFDRYERQFKESRAHGIVPQDGDRGEGEADHG